MPSIYEDDENTMRLLAGLKDRLLAPLASRPAGARVLQLRCGTWGLSLELLRRRSDLRATAIDNDPKAVGVASARATEQEWPVDVHLMSMHSLEFR